MSYRWIFKRGLPRAQLLCIKREDRSWYTPIGGRHPPRRWAYFRMANAAQMRFGRWCVTWRMPWLDEPARQLHANLFRGERSKP